MKYLLTFVALLSSTSLSLAAKSSSQFEFVPKNGALPTIVISRNASPAERFAAQEMADHLDQITGRSFTIATDENPPTGPFIAVGESKLTAPLHVHASDLGIEQYVLDVAREHLMIVGGMRPPESGLIRDRGTLYGVYDILEQLGVRWYRPEDWGTYIPHLSDPTLPVGKIASKTPAYEMRSVVGCGFQRYRPHTPEMQAKLHLWAVRNRLNWSDAGDDPKYGGHVQFSFEHSYYLYVPPSKYFKKHPEYFPLINGKRVPHGQLCIGNPQLQELFAEKVIAAARAHPHALSITIEPNDGDYASWCQDPLCRAMDDPKYPDLMSNRVCEFGNIIARRVAQAVPGMKVQWLAYSDYTEPPTLVKRLEPNIIIQLATINGWGDYSKGLFDSSSPANRGFLAALQGWRRLKPAGIMTYEYWGGYGWPGPFPIIHTIADRVRNYRGLNVLGIYSESNPNWGPQGIVLYFTAKLMWNPDLDLQRELNLYYTNYYGPAAKPMKAYHQALMRAAQAADPSVYSGGRGMEYVFTQPLVKQLGTYMDQALALAKGHEPYERRLHGVWAGYELSRLVSRVLTTEKHEGKLVQTNGGRTSYYQSAEAQQQFEQVMKFILSFDKGDAVFDFNPALPDDGSLGYLKGDILRNDAYPMPVQQVLKNF